jgi:hypothetical protein
MEQELSDSLLVIADRLGIAAENILGIFSAVQPVIGAISIATSILSMIVAVCSGYAVHRYLSSVWKDEDGDWETVDFCFLEPFLTVLAFVMCWFVSTELFTVFGENILRIVAPEYMAAKEIIGILKS